MENQYSGIFLEAFHTVIGSVSSKQIVRSDIQKFNDQPSGNDISVTIGIIGDVDGQVYMSMSAKTGQELASEMMGGMEILEVDEIVLSAVSELCNMIMGNACSSISQENRQVDITPPVACLNKMIAFGNRQSVYNISFLLKDIGNINFDVAMHSA